MIDIDHHCTRKIACPATSDDSEIKRVFMRRSRRILVLVDHTKLERRATIEVALRTRRRHDGRDE
jgi:DeoR/GlpR family transcriptional regulator of sugar metabolism